MNNFVQENEKKGREAFEQLNNDQHWFTDLQFSEDLKAQIDGVGTMKSGRKVYIEIKTRGGKYGDFFKFIQYYDTIFIDYGKLDALSDKIKNDESGAIFVSVFNDGDIILIHNLRKPIYTKHLGLQHVTNYAKKENGEDEKENELKDGLCWEDATFYRKIDGKYKRWKWTTDDYLDIIPTTKLDTEKIYRAFDQIMMCSRLKNTEPIKREFTKMIQDNADTIKEYLNINLDEEEF